MSETNHCEQYQSETEIEVFLSEVASESAQKYTVAKGCGNLVVATSCEVPDFDPKDNK